MSAAAAIREWRADPVKFVRDVFKAEPDLWQIDALALMGGPPNPARRVCMKACTGPGKSAVLAWIGWHRLLCFGAPGEHPKGAALSVTASNLKDNLWAELSKWQSRSQLLLSAFTWTAEKIYANDHPETWFLSARSFARDANAEAIGRALSGLHSQFPFVLLDETGDMPVPVGRAAQQIFTGNPQDAAIVQAGNPTSASGLLYESMQRGGWAPITITADPDDPKRTPRVSIEHARQMIETYGRDNPWVMATILGLFPPGGINALLSDEDVSAAMKRVLRPEDLAGAALILGVDVARFGLDASMIAPRQGRQAFKLVPGRNLDSVQGAGWVSRRWSDFMGDNTGLVADACFIDNTGGWGAGWIDQLGVLGRSPIGVGFAGKADDPRYFNKRTEMHFKLAEWVKSGGALPNDPELAAELTAHTYVFRGDKMWVEEKEQVREKLGRSPDRADALALTFAYDVPASPQQVPGMPGGLLSAVADSYLAPAGEREPYNPMR